MYEAPVDTFGPFRLGQALVYVSTLPIRRPRQHGGDKIGLFDFLPLSQRPTNYTTELSNMSVIHSWRV